MQAAGMYHRGLRASSLLKAPKPAADKSVMIKNLSKITYRTGVLWAIMGHSAIVSWMMVVKWLQMCRLEWKWHHEVRCLRLSEILRSNVTTIPISYLFQRRNAGFGAIQAVEILNPILLSVSSLQTLPLVYPP